jgi:hypothetical protein
VPISLAQRSRPIADNSRRSVDDRGQCARAVCCPASASIDTTSAEWEGQWTLFERYFPERKGGRPSAPKAAPKRHITHAGNGKRARSVVGSVTKKPG